MPAGTSLNWSEAMKGVNSAKGANKEREFAEHKRRIQAGLANIDCPDKSKVRLVWSPPLAPETAAQPPVAMAPWF